MTYLDLLSQGQRLCQLGKFNDALPVLEKALYKVNTVNVRHGGSFKIVGGAASLWCCTCERK